MKFNRPQREKRGHPPRRDPWRDPETRLLLDAARERAELARLRKQFALDQQGIEA